MEQDTQHKIEVVTKRRCSPRPPQYNDWSNPAVNQHRHTFQALRRMRKRPFYQSRWRQTSGAHDSMMGGGRYRTNGGYAVLYELEKIDRQIQILQSQINVLQQQLRIIQTHCVPIEPHNISPSDVSNTNTMSIASATASSDATASISVASDASDAPTTTDVNAATVAIAATVIVDADQQMPDAN